MKNGTATKPNPPAALSRPAKDQWRRYMDAYAIDDEHGRFLLGIAMEAYGRMREAAAIVKRDGASTKDRFGMPRSHPSLIVERDARAAMVAALRQLNLDVLPVQKPGRPGM